MRRFSLAIAPLILILAGCGNSLPPETDPAKGRELLKITLDAWVKGVKAEDLKSGSPAIAAFDPDWAAGYQLVKYDIAPTDGRVGVDLLVKVTLTLTKDGKTMDRTVNFCIAIGSQNVVIRQT
jgi:hypothetical protein